MDSCQETAQLNQPWVSHRKFKPAHSWSKTDLFRANDIFLVQEPPADSDTQHRHCGTHDSNLEPPSQPASQPARQPDSQPASQTDSQPASQPASQQAKTAQLDSSWAFKNKLIPAETRKPRKLGDNAPNPSTQCQSPDALPKGLVPTSKLSFLNAYGALPADCCQGQCKAAREPRQPIARMDCRWDGRLGANGEGGEEKEIRSSTDDWL